MSNKYDVIIIGAGIGGLTAAAILAKNGKKVLVLEKNHVAGGYAVNFRRGDFNFDASLHLMNGCSEGGLSYNVLKKCGALNRVNFLRSQYLYRSIYPDLDFRLPQFDSSGQIGALANYFPSERKGIEKLFKEMAKLYSDIRKFVYSDLPLNIESSFLPFKYRTLFKYHNKPYKNLLDRFIKDERLKVIIGQFWPYYGLPFDKLSSVYFVFPSYDFFRNGGYYLKGGVQSITDALLHSTKEYGGVVLLNSKITKIVLENKNAKKVITDKGEEFSASFFISNVDARMTFLELIGEQYLPVKFISKIRQMEPSISIAQVYLGLNRDLRELGFSDYEIFYNPHYDINKQFAACSGEFDIKDALFCLTLYSNIDPDAAPQGKFSMGITFFSYYDSWAKLTKEQYLQEKIRVSRELIKASEKIIPNLSSYIEKVEVATPVTMERYTGNYKGAVYGWSQVVSQSGMNRLDNRTPIRNLYLASAWTRMGGGVSMVLYAGEQAAEAILNKNKIKKSKGKT
ncbi:MAG: NAD(P)/FAD-dependent oxidoreductase [Candidatus Omnitrophica bacterium]|nr:NAD(P)/FAD-dependent oxidoreductase [Candidatus Omnitrophota bacterium]